MRNRGLSPIIHGNITSDGVHTNSWDALNRVTQIQDSNTSGTVQISYTPGSARYQETTTVGGTATTLTEVNPLFEVEATSTSVNYREMIMGGTGIVAVRTIQNNGILTTRYITGDHLGSISQISDEVGNVTERMSYDAFGQRTDPTTWQTYTGSVPNLTDTTDKGYTGQQQLDAVGIIHMNGRAYDPQIGRFISADPTIPDPLYSQSFNRYAYVNNNPLSATDPSGFDSSYPLTTNTYINGVPYEEEDTCTTTCSVYIDLNPQLGTITVTAPIASTQAPLPPDMQVPIPPAINSTPSQIPDANQTAPAAPSSSQNDNSDSSDNWGDSPDNFLNAPQNTGPVGYAIVASLGDITGWGGTKGPSAPPRGPVEIPGPNGHFSGSPTAGNPHSTGSIGAGNGAFGAYLEYPKTFLHDGLWKGSNGMWYTVGKCFGNQYGRTAAQTEKIVIGAKWLGRGSLVLGLGLSVYQYQNDIRAGNTLGAVNDSVDFAMTGVATVFPYGTIAAALWFGGEFLYDSGVFSSDSVTSWGNMPLMP